MRITIVFILLSMCAAEHDSEPMFTSQDIKELTSDENVMDMIQELQDEAYSSVKWSIHAHLRDSVMKLPVTVEGPPRFVQSEYGVEPILFLSGTLEQLIARHMKNYQTAVEDLIESAIPSLCRYNTEVLIQTNNWDGLEPITLLGLGLSLDRISERDPIYHQAVLHHCEQVSCIIDQQKGHKSHSDYVLVRHSLIEAGVDPDIEGHTFEILNDGTHLVTPKGTNTPIVFMKKRT